MIPVIGNKAIDEVCPEDIEAIQRRILKRAKAKSNATRSGRVAVKNTLAYIRQLFNLAKKKKLIKLFKLRKNIRHVDLRIDFECNKYTPGCTIRKISENSTL